MRTFVFEAFSALTSFPIDVCGGSGAAAGAGGAAAGAAGCDDVLGGSAFWQAATTQTLSDINARNRRILIALSF